MAITTSDLVKRKLNLTDADEILVDTDEIADSIDEAVKEYSRAKPREIIDHFAGQDEYDYDIANLLPNWVDDFSNIKDIEYPAGEQAAEIIEDIDWEIYKPDPREYSIADIESEATEIVLSTVANALFFKKHDCIYIKDETNSEINWAAADGNTTTGVVTLKNAAANDYESATVSKRKVLRFPNHSPAADEIIRVIYTATHTHSTDADTIPTIDYDAVVNLAAAIAALKVAAHFAKSADSSIGADAIDYITKAALWKDQADKYLGMYKEHLGIRDGEPAAASKTKDWDLTYPWGSDYLFHGRRSR